MERQKLQNLISLILSSLDEINEKEELQTLEILLEKIMFLIVYKKEPEFSMQKHYDRLVSEIKNKVGLID